MKKLLCGAMLACLALAHPAYADYPDRPIRLVVPTGAGGITDQLARVLAEKLGTILEQSIVVENKAGASGVIGSALVANAKPDGYTLLMAFPSHVANPSMKKSLPYDTVKDFASISKVGMVAEILLVNNEGGIDDVKTLLGKARKSPEGLAYGSVGTGSLADFCTRMLQDQADIKLLSVTYKSDPDVLLALIRNDIQMAFVAPPAALPMISAGRVKALAVSSGKRLPSLPDVPTVSEAGVAGYDTTGWNAIFAPAGTPREIVATLNKAINTALADPQLVEKFTAIGVPPLGGTSEELQQSLEKDIAGVKAALERAGFTPQ
jgi:tripartite-type tricarboxylate transporter receptor subunit TctC